MFSGADVVVVGVCDAEVVDGLGRAGGLEGGDFGGGAVGHEDLGAGAETADPGDPGDLRESPARGAQTPAAQGPATSSLKTTRSVVGRPRFTSCVDALRVGSRRGWKSRA